MYHSLKSTRKRRRRKRLLTAIFLASLCVGLALGYLWMEEHNRAEIPAVPWIVDFVPRQASTRKREVYTVVLPAQTVYCPEVSLPIGTERIMQAGEDGELRCTAEVVYENGREISRTILSRDLVREPVDRIIARGQQEETAVEIKNGYIRLTDGQSLTYTRTAAIRASAYPQAAGVSPLTVGGQTLCIGIAAVDPSLIPPGTRLFVTTADSSFTYGIARTIDGGRTGNRMELYFPTAAECNVFGERMCNVYFLG